jgi:hypothetical protein
MSVSFSVGQLPYNSSCMSHSKWVLDSSASHHISLDSSSFIVSLLPSILVMIVDDTLMSLAGVGFVVTPHFSLPNVYFIPKLKLNLASIIQLCDYGE